MQLSFSKELRRLSTLYMQLLSRELPALAADHFVEVLQLLRTVDGPITQKRLAESLKIDKSRVSVILTAMSDQQYVHIVPDPSDKRAHSLRLTDKAIVALPVVDTAVRKLHALLYQDLAPEQIEIFHQVLAKMERNLIKAFS